MNRPAPGCWLVAATWILAVHMATASTAPAVEVESDDEKLARFLDRLDLTELQIAHIESVLEKRLPPEKRITLAKRLADLYAERIMNVGGDPVRLADTQQRIEKLLAAIPQADTASLRVMLLQADYNRAEVLAAQWTADPNRADSRQQSQAILTRITPQLNKYQRQLSTETAALIEVVDNMEDDKERVAKEKELQRLQAVSGRASYFAGWSNYYLGLLRAPLEAGEFGMARTIFRGLLDIDDEDTSYDKLDSEWLGLESAWRSRAMIGLGLTEAAVGDVRASQHCFELLDHASVPPEIQDQAPYWFMQGLLSASQLDEAYGFASQQIKAYSGQPSPGKVSLCVSLVRAGFAGNTNPVEDVRQKIGVLGLEGLAKMGQISAVQQLIDKYQIQLPEAEGFLLRWVGGRRLLLQAEKSKAADDYRRAADALQQALTAPDAASQAGAAAECRFQLAACQFQLAEYEAAGRTYEEAITGLKRTNPDRAAQAAWMAFASYLKLSKDQPRFATTAVDVLRTLKRDFPGHEYAKRADYYIGKLQSRSEDPHATIARLERVPASSPSYSAALYDICVARFQLWESATADQRVDQAEKCLTAVDNSLATRGNESDPRRQLKCHLIAVAIAVSETPPDDARAEIHLTQAVSAANRLPEEDSLLAEYHYRRLQLARRNSDLQATQRHAAWLVEHAPGSAYELAGLVTAAQDLDQQIATAEALQRRTLIEQAGGVYKRLALRLGNSPEVLRSNKNSRVANFKFADYAFQLGRFTESAQILERLLEAFPDNTGYLQRAGIAHFRAGQYAAGLVHWRKLLSGLPDGSAEWYEAKYYQLASLAASDPATARKVMQQFKLLHPRLGPPDWQEKFRVLETSLANS